MQKEDRRTLTRIRNENEDAQENIRNIIQRLQNHHINKNAISKIEEEEKLNRICTLKSIEIKMNINKMLIDEILEIEKPYEERISMFS